MPLFLSRRTLAPRMSLPRARGSWALDSGGFSELTLFGEWTITPEQYVVEVRRFQSHVGNLQWCASMDFMCEPHVLKKTGLTVSEHQRRTIENYLHLRTLAPDLPIVPVIQGWTESEYLRHVEDYLRSGIDLEALPLVGLGSICRRQGTRLAESVISRLHKEGISLHGFGMKITGLQKNADLLVSADSMAWSMQGRYQSPLPGCPHRHCNNCLRYALKWRRKVLDAIPEEVPAPPQLVLTP